MKQDQGNVPQVRFVWAYYTLPSKVSIFLQRLQNGLFFPEHVQNQTVPSISVFFWETFEYLFIVHVFH